MRVRKVRMRVSDRVVPMPMGVSHAGHHRMRMLVLMMLVVHMLVRVLEIMLAVIVCMIVF